jgi:hypothetical protein
MEEILWRDKALCVPGKVSRGGTYLGGAMVLKLAANIHAISERVKDPVSHAAKLDTADTELDAGNGPQIKTAQRLGGFAGDSSSS